MHPGATKWIFEEARLNAAHIRDTETRTLTYQPRDNLLHRLLPFALVSVFTVSSVTIAIFSSPIAGGAGIVATVAGVLIAYLRGLAPRR